MQDPFQLSMSDTLLAATVLCADRRCRAVVTALNRKRADGGGAYGEAVGMAYAGVAVAPDDANILVW